MEETTSKFVYTTEVILCPIIQSLPNTFVGIYLGKSPLDDTLRKSDGNLWHVIYRAGAQYRLAKGWKTFVLENQLKLNGVCRFELLAKSPGHAELKFSVIGMSS